jgi:hypothetical protein
MAARRKLLNILPRNTLEAIYQFERPHMKSMSELVIHAAERWNEDEVRAAIELIFHKAAD